jgi:hypothetical protein
MNFRKLLLCFLFLPIGLFAQEKKPIQFSGVIRTNASPSYVSFVNIQHPSSKRGSISDYQGYFSFVAFPGDTFRLSAIGYRDLMVILPSTIEEKTYSKNLEMERDTLQLPVVNIYPWPDYETFKKDFLTRQLADDDLAAAQKNLMQYDYLTVGRIMPMDGAQNSKIFFQNQVTKMYYQGQYATNQLLNPLAWAQFIHMIKEGKISFRNE